MQKKALIIGAGIGGLCSAIALQRKGWNVSVWEKSNKLSGLGAGIVLASNALYALERLGVAKEVTEQGSRVKNAHILSSEGEMILSLPTDAQAKKHGTYSYLIHRGMLQNILLDKIKDKIQIHLNKEIKQLYQTEQKVTAIATDGYEEEATILIGADGIHSNVRKMLFGQEKLRYSGYTALRGVCDFHMEDDEGGGFEAWGKGKRFGFTKIGEGKYFWFAAINSPEGRKFQRDERKKAALHFLKDWCYPIEEVIQATSESDILHHDIYDRTPLKKWSKGRVTLLGDAAHPMLPNLGQGGAQAMEDAIVLSNSLEDNPLNHEKAFLAYEKDRIPRTTKIVHQSRKMARLVQLENPLLLQTRNTLFRILPANLFASRMDWVVGYKVGCTKD